MPSQPSSTPATPAPSRKKPLKPLLRRTLKPRTTSSFFSAPPWPLSDRKFWDFFVLSWEWPFYRGICVFHKVLAWFFAGGWGHFGGGDVVFTGVFYAGLQVYS